LQQIESFALRNSLHHVYQDDVGQFLVGNAQRAISAHVPSAHNGDFLSQNKLLFSGE
jgi:hypothetical protein